MNIRATVVGALVALAVALPAHAQGEGSQQQPVKPPQRGGRGNPALTPEQKQLGMQIERAFRQKVHEEVGLTDEQFRKVGAISQKYNPQRRAINQQDMATRMAMREELAKPQPDDAKIQQYMQQLQALPQQRLDLSRAEQKDLGTIMSPVQLAKYQNLEEKVQRQLNQIRRSARDSSKAP
jgi:Spy/CpxP family protein refolding chaperone